MPDRPALAEQIAATLSAALKLIEATSMTVGGLSNVTGIPAREIGAMFAKHRDLVDAACAARGIEITAYHRRIDGQPARIDFRHA
jgi:hypothetical protein